MVFLTEFGDSALLLPLAGAILVWLIAMRSRRAALWWLLALTACAGGIALLKIYFIACASNGPLQSPSGHSGLSTLVYGGLAWLVASRVEGWRRVAALGLCAVLIVGIALSRLALGAHTPPDVAAGLVIGLVALAIFLVGSAGRIAPSASTRSLLLAVIVVVAIFHGDQLHAQAMLHAVGAYLKAGVACS